MIKNEKFRHEFKYVCSDSQLQLIQTRIKSLLTIDSHTDGNDSYCIRSLYFDDIYNSCFYENHDGVQPREKFRIRIYNYDTQYIRLELKAKIYGKTQKHSCPLTLEQCTLLMKGKEINFSDIHFPVLRKLCMSMRLRMMKPKIIVEYERSPFVHLNSNTRITLDRNISSSSAVEMFLEKNIPKRQIMPTGHGIMEVKYDEYLPDHIYRSLHINNLRQETFSKYYFCRKYNMEGI